MMADTDIVTRLLNLANTLDPPNLSEPERELLRDAAALIERLRKARAVVDEQANDGSLWFVAETITEDILQKALRRLHAAVEGITPEECARRQQKDRPF